VSAGNPFLLVIAAPSGTGKTSLAHALVGAQEHAVFSVSATTRAPRAGEREGVDYHFVDDAEFERMIAARELVEWAIVHGRRYGTPWYAVRSGLEAGNTVVLDIDIQGARHVREAFPDAVLVFILPPGAEELRRRLEGRNSEGRDDLKRRLGNALGELDASAEFDYVVVNDQFERALQTLEAIFHAERHAVTRAQDLTERVRVIQDGIRGILDKELQS
jgi:guanylate kinase